MCLYQKEFVYSKFKETQEKWISSVMWLAFMCSFDDDKRKVVGLANYADLCVI